MYPSIASRAPTTLGVITIIAGVSLVACRSTGTTAVETHVPAAAVPAPDAGSAPQTDPTAASNASSSSAPTRCEGWEASQLVQPSSGLVADADGRVHRPAQARCASAPARPAVVPNASGRAEGARCDRDADCNLHAYGVCDAANQLGIGACVYGCASDADCGDGKLCVCGDRGGRCLTASCRTDAECGAGRLCARYFPLSGSREGFACTTAGDECDRDCMCERPDGARRVCDYDHGVRRCVMGGRRVY